MIKDAELSGAVLVKTLDKLLGDRDRLGKMAEASRRLGKPRALDDILDLLEEIIRGKG
jgi:UDP-N-acetylglucosamine--N-acetylmuramyl-(pentapeptide) pyrophosphoryl-undecaprenol N-acetylglucosamine transferase